MIDTQLVIDLYTSGVSAVEIAERLNCSGETVRKKLRKAGFNLKKLNLKYCKALVLMLFEVCEMNTSDIVQATGIPTNSVCQIIRRKHGECRTICKKRKTDFDIDAIETEYLAGASTYELGEKYGVYHSTISTWMIERGHFRGKEYGSKKGTEVLTQRAIERDKQRLLEEGGKIELIEYGGNQSTYCCTGCGLVFTRWHGYRQRVVCPHCYSLEIAKQKTVNDARREEERKQSEQKRLEEYAKDKICASCGGIFHSERQGAKFCSQKCRTKNQINKKLARNRKKTALRQLEEFAKDKVCACCGDIFHSVYESKIYCDECAMKHRNCDHRLRAKKYGVAYESGITLEKLIERDGNVCQICGEPCDRNDNSWGNGIGSLYPTIDHIIAMANGGGHTWDNVQLAHAICNSVKRDLSEEELTEEVIAYAKEQAIADKCA